MLNTPHSHRNSALELELGEAPVRPQQVKKHARIIANGTDVLNLWPAPLSNHLLASLPRKDCARMTAQCDSVDLSLGAVLAEPGINTSFVYFPVRSFISLIAETDGKLGLEVGMVGREGMLRRAAHRGRQRRASSRIGARRWLGTAHARNGI